MTSNERAASTRAGATYDDATLALAVVARVHGLRVDLRELETTWPPDRPPQTTEIRNVARTLGLRTRVVRPNSEQLPKLKLPGLYRTRAGAIRLLLEYNETEVRTQEPRQTRPLRLTRATFLTDCDGEILLFAPSPGADETLRGLGFAWFASMAMRYKAHLGEVLVASFFVQILALATPLFFQLVADKVIAHRSYGTLDVLAVGFGLAIGFEVFLSALRSYVLAHTVNRLDAVMSSRILRHLLRLPLAYFESRRVGDSVARIRELENVRSFFTGTAMTAVLDIAFSVMFLALMAIYSPTLTWVVIASVPLLAVTVIVTTPLLRANLVEKFTRGAEVQGRLVEAVSQIETIKAAAVEEVVASRWNEQLAGQLSAGFRATQMAIICGQVVAGVGKLVTLVTVWLGAREVMAGRLTIGELVAFNMFAARVLAPLTRLAQLWQEFQQVGISLARLGDIVSCKTEQGTDQVDLTPIRGAIRFEGIDFRYRADRPLALRCLTVDIPPGQVVGIVGRSGSGKSTLVKLLQSFYSPESGRILIDDRDLRLTDPAWLRRQVGLVPQETRLLQQSIRDNIALCEPTASLERVMSAAKLAGAHDFITELPEGYETLLGEYGVGLSGGQRQRIAIARALLPDPTILVLDEATSALDYESERVLQKNLARIAAGRTVLIIAHRLSAVRRADRIVVLDGGRIIEDSTHAELIARGDGFYSRLWAEQSAP